MPAPEVAVNYYTGGDLYLFGKFFYFYDLWLSTGGKNWNFTLPCHFLQMNFKHPEFQIQEDLR